MSEFEENSAPEFEPTGPISRTMKNLDTVANMISRTALVLLLLAVLTQVFTRYVLNNPVQGVIGITELYLMPIIVFGSMSYLEMQGGHVRVGILYDALPDRVRHGLGVVLRVISAGFFGLVAYTASAEAMNAYSRGYFTSGDIEAPLATTLIIAPIGCALLTLRLLINAAGDWQAAFAPDNSVGGIK